jgi:hypothetical protein
MPALDVYSPGMNYRSGTTFLGLPLVHITTGSMVNGQYRRGVATGWIAIGDIAVGVLFAAGGLAAGGICVGGLALGVFSVAGLSIGVIAIGGAAIGVAAMGGAAVAWYAAMGGLAVAHSYAIGGVAHAQHVMAPQSSGPFPFSSIPHPPFRASDAIILFMLVGALAVFARSIRERRKEGQTRDYR